METLSVLIAMLALPYLLAGLGLPFVWMATPRPGAPSEWTTFGPLLLLLGVIWAGSFALARWLVVRRLGEAPGDDSPWTVVFPSSVRLFSLAAPAAFAVGLLTGGVLVHTVGPI